MLYAGAVVPTAIEDDNLARRGKVRHVPLHIHLSFFTIRWGRKCHYPEYSWADTFRDRPDCAAFSGAVTAFKHDDYA